MELKAEIDQGEKFKRCAELYECMQEPARYTRRIYRALPRILQDIEWIRTSYLGIFGEQRKVDQYAPLLAAAWAAQSKSRIAETPEGKEWLSCWIERLSTETQESVEDEDAVVRHLIAAQIRTDDGVQRTVAELLATASGDTMGTAANLLSRQGIRIMRHGSDLVVAVSIDNQHVRRILANTPYESGYGAQLKRHKLCIEQSKVIRFACGQSRACLIDWHGFREAYLGEIAAPVAADDTTPF
jgi:hypothetical protein